MLEKISKFLPGMKTYIGIFMTLLAALSMQLGWDWWGTIEADLKALLEQLMTFVGLLLAFVGRVVAKP